MNSRGCSRAAATFVRGGTLPLCRERACEERLGAVKDNVAWTMMANDVEVFVQNYLHCVATIPGDRVPRPLDTQLHATKLKEILHFDFRILGCQETGSISTCYLSRII
jgi:hypothetical protein